MTLEAAGDRRIVVAAGGKVSFNFRKSRLEGKGEM